MEDDFEFEDSYESEEDAEETDNEPDESWFDGDALASAGFGTDEDYGYSGGDDW